MSTIIRNRRFLNLCRDAAFKLRTPQDEGLASSLAARNGAEVVRGLVPPQLEMEKAFFR